VGASSLAKGSKCALNFYQPITKEYALGTNVECDCESQTSLLTLGSSYKPYPDVVVKAKAKVGKKADKADVFTVTAFAERSFANPAIKVGVTAEFDVLKSVHKPSYYGVSVSLGDN